MTNTTQSSSSSLLNKSNQFIEMEDLDTNHHVHYGSAEILNYTDSVDGVVPSTMRNTDAEYSPGYHSIHKLSRLSSKDGGNNLKRAFEARIGGTTNRTLGRSTRKDVMVEKHADFIVSKMEQDEALMEDSPDAEELRRTALRDMPQCLTLKRCVKAKLSKSVSQKSKKKPIGCYKMLKYRYSMFWAKLQNNVRDLAYSFELWYDLLKKIEGNFGTGVASFFKLLRWLLLVNLAICIVTLCFIIIPRAAYGRKNSKNFDWSNMKDFFTGEGYLTDTLLYYGHYVDDKVNTVPTLTYSMSHAYFFTMALVYLVSFVVIGYSAAKAYRKSFIETEGGLKNVFANKVFCGWDYNIATKDAANLKSKAIFNELRELLSEYAWKNQNRTFCDKVQTRALQFFMNIFILGLMIGTGTLIWYFLHKVSFERGIFIIIIPIFINAVMTFMPMLFSFLVRYEDYKSPKVALFFTLARTFLLGAVTVGVLVTFWLKNPNSVNSTCWETSLGQEIYRMIIFDFFISVLSAAVLDVVLYGFYKLRKNVYLEFDIAWNTMQIIYNQTLFWVGLVFSPLLPLVVSIKLFLTWYIRVFVVMLLCKPSEKSWRAAQTTAWFLVMTFLSLLCIGGLLGYIVSYIGSSTGCGPFQKYNFIYEIVTEGVLQLKANSTVWSIVLYMTKPGVLALILIAMCVQVYNLRAQSIAQKETVSHYRNMLVWAAKDKEYCFSLFSQVSNGQWQYQLGDHGANPELHSTEVIFNHAVGDVDRTAPSSASQLLSTPSSGITFPSSSTTSYDLSSDDRGDYLDIGYKKYS